mgnify:CR=1 FL=1
MKKLLCLALSLLMLFSIIRCNSNNNSQNEEETNNAEQVTGKYMTFEELLNCASDVVIGTCVGVDVYNSYKEYKFNVEKRFWGEDSDDLIYVYVPNRTVTIVDTNITYGLYDIVYEENESYYLVLTRTVDVYLDHDRYMNVGANIYLPVDNSKTLQMYGQELTKHSSISTNDLTNYFASYNTNNVAKYSGIDYIKSNDKATIINSSDFVLRVEVLEEVYAGIADDRNTYDCNVIAAYKGDVEIESTVRIVFPKDAVVIGGEYILALYEFDNVTPRSFVYSSKNSLFNVNEADTIMQYINAEME